MRIVVLNEQSRGWTVEGGGSDPNSLDEVRDLFGQPRAVGDAHNEALRCVEYKRGVHGDLLWCHQRGHVQYRSHGREWPCFGDAEHVRARNHPIPELHTSVAKVQHYAHAEQQKNRSEDRNYWDPAPTAFIKSGSEYVDAKNWEHKRRVRENKTLVHLLRWANGFDADGVSRLDNQSRTTKIIEVGVPSRSTNAVAARVT